MRKYEGKRMSKELTEQQNRRFDHLVDVIFDEFKNIQKSEEKLDRSEVHERIFDRLVEEEFTVSDEYATALLEGEEGKPLRDQEAEQALEKVITQELFAISESSWGAIRVTAFVPREDTDPASLYISKVWNEVDRIIINTDKNEIYLESNDNNNQTY